MKDEFVKIASTVLGVTWHTRRGLGGPQEGFSKLSEDAAHYEVQEVEFGYVYKWCPESILLKCECGETTSLTASEPICQECRAEHTGLVREDLANCQLRGDEEIHPWRYSEGIEEDIGLPY